VTGGDVAPPHSTPSDANSRRAAIDDGRRTLLLVLPWSLREIGGVNEVVRNLIVRAQASGCWHPVLLESDYGIRRPLRAHVDGVDTVRMRLTPAWLPGDGLRRLAALLLLWPLNLLRVARLIASLRPECINIHYIGPATLTLLLAARLTPARPRLVLSFHGSDITYFTERGAWHRRLLGWMVRLADSSVCCSHALLQQLREGSSDPVSHGAVIHHGIDVARTRGLVKDESRSSEGVGSDYLVNVATFEPKKGQDLLLRAFAQARDQLPGLKLVLAGRESPWLVHLQTLISELRLGDRVVVLQNLSHPDALRLISGARLFVLGSRREPFGIVLLEAAVLEIPVLSTSAGGVPEVVVDGQTGVLVACEDIDALAHEMVRLCRDRELAERLARAAAQRVRDTFTWERAFAAYEAQCKRTGARASAR
jgi:L-malate glycosyltransferase